MILSMTGYGKAEITFRNHKLICEIRSLNSKSMDLSVRLAPCLRAKELDIRTIVNQRLERGKVDLLLINDEMSARFVFRLIVIRRIPRNAFHAFCKGDEIHSELGPG